MGFVPAVFEGAAITFIAPFFFDISILESAILGFIVAAVSPAIVVPMMLRFIESNKGAKKGIPTLLLASSSLDNVFAIVISSALIGMYSGKGTNIFMKLLDIPVSISLGIALGAVIGFALYRVFKKYQPRATKEGMIVIGAAIIFLGLIARSIGTYAALTGTDFDVKEKLFCIVSYIPKATVQTAIGAVPLSLGVKSGDIILAVAVLAILFTAPLGAIGMNIIGEKVLEK